MDTKGTVAVCGSGHIGRGWAMLFASGGYRVNLFDTDPSRVDDAIKDIKKQLFQLDEENMLRGSHSLEKHIELIRGVTSLEECVRGAEYVQECIPEDIGLKKKFFSQLEELVSSTAIMASSSSSISPSFYTADLKKRANCLVSHPINPPYVIRVIEIVPSPWTSPETIARTKDFMEELGQKPVTFNKEILGFGVNRMQLAILKECWQLVTEGYLSAPDVDTLMCEGLGMRYAWQGPFETCHLLADGIRNSIRHFGPSFALMAGTMEATPSFNEQDSAQIIQQMDEKVPLDHLESRRKWRDERLIALVKLKETINELQKNGN